MPLIFCRCILLFFFVLSLRDVAFGQNKPSLYVNPLLLSRIETQLQQFSQPATYEFIPKFVSEHFRNQPDSVYRNLFAVMIRLERRFNLDAAIYGGEELAKLAEVQHEPGRQAAAYMELSRYYDAGGTYQLAALNIEKALTFYRVLGDENAILSAEYARLALKLHFVSREAIIPLLEVLLEKAVASDANSIVRKVHQQLLEQNLLAGNYGEAEKHVIYLEKLPVSDPIKPQEYPYLINTAKGRGDLALARNNLAEAERYYLKTLGLTQAEPGPWFEIHTLHALARLAHKNSLIQQHADQLQSLDAAKSHFFANISHELRTPLTLIMGPINTLLKENPFSEKQALLLRTASRSARQLELNVGYPQDASWLYEPIK